MLLYETIAAWRPETVANIFVIVMAIVMLLAVYCIFTDSHRPFQQFAPNLLTTLGILGTFIGISIGLATFDVDQIEGSIPKLLEGLKTAFLTSVVGISLSIITRSLGTWSAQERAAAPQEVGPQNILATLDLQQKTLTDIKEQLEASNTNSLEMRRAISGEGDASVVTQLQKVRVEIQDGLGAIRFSVNGGDNKFSISEQFSALTADLNSMGERVATEFRSFAEQVSEIGSKQLVEALQQVIQDFNKNITEQFGDNFKRLDESVGKLLQWQVNYSKLLVEMDKQLKLTVETLGSTEQSVSTIASESAVIPEHMQKLASIMTAAQVQVEELDRHLAAFAQMSEKATGAVPQIQQHIDGIIEETHSALKNVTSHYDSMAVDTKAVITGFTESSRDLQQSFVKEVGEAISTATTSVTEGSRKVHEQSESTVQAIREGANMLQTKLEESATRLDQQTNAAFSQQNQNMQALFTGLREQLQRATDEHNQLMNQGIQNLDKRLQDELERAMQHMANNLGAITGKFVEDYSALTTRMQQVVERTRSAGS